MSRSTGNVVFGLAFVACFVGAMCLIMNGKVDFMVAPAAAIVLGAESVVFAMIYASTYHDGHEEEEAREAEAKAHAKH